MSALKDTFLIFCPGYKYSPKIQTIFNLTFLVKPALATISIFTFLSTQNKMRKSN